MTAWAHRIEGVALTANITAADVIVAALPDIETSRFATGIPVQAVGGTTEVGRFLSIASRQAAVDAATALLAGGLPAAIHAARIIPRSQDGSSVAWLASMGFEPMDVVF